MTPIVVWFVTRTHPISLGDEVETLRGGLEDHAGPELGATQVDALFHLLVGGDLVIVAAVVLDRITALVDAGLVLIAARVVVLAVEPLVAVVSADGLGADVVAASCVSSQPIRPIVSSSAAAAKAGPATVNACFNVNLIWCTSYGLNPAK